MTSFTNFIETTTKTIEAGIITYEEIPALLSTVESMSTRIRKEAEKTSLNISDLKEVGKSLEEFAYIIFTRSKLDLSGDDALKAVSIMRNVATLKALYKW